MIHSDVDEGKETPKNKIGAQAVRMRATCCVPNEAGVEDLVEISMREEMGAMTWMRRVKSWKPIIFQLHGGIGG